MKHVFEYLSTQVPSSRQGLTHMKSVIVSGGMDEGCVTCTGSSLGSGRARGQMTTARGIAPILQRSLVAGTLLSVGRMHRGEQSPLSATTNLVLVAGGF